MPVPETIRERLKRRMLWANAAFVGITLFGFILPEFVPIEDDARRLTLGIGAVALVAWAAFATRFPCPRCGGNIGGAFGYRASGFAPSGRKDKPISNCPHCGASLDVPWP
jgi:hypothetical protein